MRPRFPFVAPELPFLHHLVKGLRAHWLGKEVLMLSLTRKMIVSAALAMGLLTSGGVANAQTTRYDERTGTANRTEYGGGGFDWGWLGLLGLFGLLGARGRVRHDVHGTFDRRETYEPRPTR